MLQKISPFLWFDNNAEEAAKFYTSVFDHGKITATTYYTKGTPGPEGSVMTVQFQLDGQEFVALNGGPTFKFSSAISFVVNCETQQEVDKYWDKLCSGGGKEVECGWLTDKFGLSWQIVPTAMMKMLASKDTAAVQRAMQAMMKMKKLDIAILEKAFNNG